MSAYTNYLDPSFGIYGSYNIDITISGVSYPNVPTTIEKQSSGKIIVAGYTTVSSNQILTLLRYDLSSNMLDTSFGTNGIFVLSSNPFNSVGKMHILPDDKILVVGKTNANNAFIAKINENGGLDTSFGTNGISEPLNGILVNTIFNRLNVDSNGNIFIGGSRISSTSFLLIVKLTNTGILDTTFNNIGYHMSQETDPSSNLIYYSFAPITVFDIKFDNNQKIVACMGTGGVQERGIIVRLNVDGTRDNTFNNNGMYIPNEKGGFREIIVLSDGKYLVCGYHNLSFNNSLRVFRITQTGTVEVSLLWKGITDNLICEKFLLTSDNKLVLFGSSNGSITPNGNKIIVAKFNYFTTNTTPTIDTTYGNNGYLLTYTNNILSDVLLDNENNNLVYISSAKMNANNDFNIGKLSITSSIQNPANPTLSNFPAITKNVTDSSFNLGLPISDSSGSISFTSSNTSVATISGNRVTIVAAGSTIITATQSPTSNFNSGEITTTLTVNKLNPTLSNFSTTITKTYTDGSFVLVNPTSNSDGSFNYVSSNLSVATISGNVVTIVGAGSTTITATQESTSIYNSGSISRTLTVTKSNSILSNFNPITKTYTDGSFVLIDPSSNSDGSFNYTSSNTSVATISGKVVTIVGLGTTTITATQQSTSNFNSATTTSTLTVTKANPILSNFNPITKTYTDGSFVLVDPSSNNSTGTFSYSSSNTSVATISGKIVTIVGSGSTTITATQSSTSNFNSGTITTTLTINNSEPSLSNFNSITKYITDGSFVLVDPSSNSTGTFSYSSSDSSVATISGKVVTIVGLGSTTITATQSSTSNFNSGTIATTLTIIKANPVLSNFPTSISKMLIDGSFVLVDPSSNSDGSFNYVSSNASVATISGKVVTIVGLGSTTITATQEATNLYNSASTTSTLTVTKTNPVLSNFSTTITKTIIDGSFVLVDPSSNSDGSFNYVSSNTSVATISGKVVSIVGLGSTTITATQDSTNLYNSASTTSTLTVTKANPVLSNFSPISKIGSDSSFVLIDPSSNSDGSFNYVSSNTSVATISGKIVTLVGSGSTTITATQSSTSLYNSATITATLTITKANPVLSNFNAITKNITDSSFVLVNPSSNSDGSFNFVSSNPSVATISGKVVTIVGAGITTITAIQSSTSLYNSGSIAATLTINKINSNITNFNPITKMLIDGSFVLVDPSSNSDGTFSYSSSNTSVATISGKVVTLIGLGTTTITVTQSATSNFNSETSTTTLTVIKANPVLSNFTSITKTIIDGSFVLVDPSSNSDGSFNYVSSNTSVATISGKVVTIVGLGSTTITATQEATNLYNSASTTCILTVTKANPVLSNFPPISKIGSDSSFVLVDPSSNSDGSFNYVSLDSSVATISGKVVTLVSSGSTTITATQSSTSLYNSAIIASILTITKATPVLSNFSSTITKTLIDSSFVLVDPSSNNSTGTFSYSSSNSSVATISGKVVTIVGLGSTTITATQASTSLYNSATTTSTLTVIKANPSITNFPTNITKTIIDGSFVLIDPSSNSNGSFNYVSSNTSVATISGKVVTIVGLGSTTITATQASTTLYNSATTTSTLTVTKANPVLSNFSVPFNGLGTFTLVDPSSNSDGSFNYTSSNTSVATISGKNINVLTIGTSTITATQSPTSIYNSGTITATLNVIISYPSINFTVPNNKVYSDSPFILSATSTSPAPIIYSSSNPLVATISGNTVTITGPGSTVITASQIATTNYYAKSVTATLNIGIPAFPICFPAGTPVVTDQGEIAIEKINPDKNTIRGKKIVAITKTVTIEDKIVCIEKNSLGPNIPSQKTFISRNHKLLYNKQMIKAKHLIGQVDGVYNKKYKGEVLYNVLLETHEKMIVNNLIVETLDPNNIIAQLYNGALSVEERNNAIVTINQAANEYKNQYGKLK